MLPHNIRYALISLTFIVALTGCVAVWGEAHKVIEADSNGIKIQYDGALTSTARASFLAKEHCQKYGKIAEPIDAKMPGLLFGIIEESYLCVPPPN